MLFVYFLKNRFPYFAMKKFEESTESIQSYYLGDISEDWADRMISRLAFSLTGLSGELKDKGNEPCEWITYDVSFNTLGEKIAKAWQDRNKIDHKDIKWQSIVG